MLIWNMPAIVRGHCFQPLSFREQLSIFSIPFSSLQAKKGEPGEAMILNLLYRKDIKIFLDFLFFPGQ